MQANTHSAPALVSSATVGMNSVISYTTETRFKGTTKIHQNVVLRPSRYSDKIVAVSQNAFAVTRVKPLKKLCMLHIASYSNWPLHNVQHSYEIVVLELAEIARENVSSYSWLHIGPDSEVAMGEFSVDVICHFLWLLACNVLTSLDRVAADVTERFHGLQRNSVQHDSYYEKKCFSFQQFFEKSTRIHRENSKIQNCKRVAALKSQNTFHHIQELFFVPRAGFVIAVHHFPECFAEFHQTRNIYIVSDLLKIHKKLT